MKKTSQIDNQKLAQGGLLSLFRARSHV